MSKFSRALVAAAALAMIVPGTARAQSYTWDFAGLAGNSSNLGTSFDFVQAAYGTITAFTSSGFRLTSKGAGTTYPNAEKGLGLCVWSGSTCSSGDEIGDGAGNTGSLYLNFLGLLPGVDPVSIFLASVQSGEGWVVNYSGDASCTSGSTFGTSVSSTGPTVGTAFVNLAVASTVTCIRLDPVATGTGGKDYLLSSATTFKDDSGGPQETVPEPATMTLLATGLAGMAAARRKKRRG